ncbi:MAG: hypothetical protein QXM16_06865 [Nitrososphaerota archaeon]
MRKTATRPMRCRGGVIIDQTNAKEAARQLNLAPKETIYVVL